MYSYQSNKADTLWRNMAYDLAETRTIQPSSNPMFKREPTKIKELLQVPIMLLNPRERLVFARPINPALAIAEVIWIMSGSNSLGFIKFWNPRMAKCSDDQETLYGAYGMRLGCRPDLYPDDGNFMRRFPVNGDTEALVPGSYFDQLRKAYRVLKADPTQRQVVLQIWDYNFDFPEPPDNFSGGYRSADVPCNVMAMLRVSKDKLYWSQIMRSNDLVWGTPYNLVQWTTIHEIVAGWLGLELGSYTLFVNSLHAYEEFWDELEDVDDKWPAPKHLGNTSDLRILGYNKWAQVFSQVVNCVNQFIMAQSQSELLSALHNGVHVVTNPAYQEWLYLLGYEALRRKGWAQVDDLIRYSQQMGEYYGTSWRQWLLYQKSLQDKRDIA